MNISDASKIKFLREMLRIRLFEEKICDLYGEQEMRCPVHLSIGQEAPAVGMCEALRKEDLVFGTHRSHSHYIAKGGNLNRLMGELYGKATGCCKGIGGSMHSIDLDAGFVAATPIVGSSIPIAMGAAMANQMKGNDLVTVLFLGDAAVEEGVFHETINLASVKKLPLIFFCENNFYSVYTPLKSRQPERPLEKLAAGHNVKAITVDGNNVIEVYSAAKHACESVRDGNGPVFIEAITYRWREHCGTAFDNHIGYREEAEYEEWRKKCPIERFEKELLGNKTISPVALETMKSEIMAEIDAAVLFAKESPFLDAKLLPEFLYAQ